MHVEETAMSMMAPISVGRDWTEHVLTRLVRRYATARETGEPALPSLVGLAGRLGVSSTGAVAAASLFELTEAVLGRPLRTGRACHEAASADERALLLMLAHAPRSGSVRTSRAVPHGLPGVLAWAATSAVLALGTPDCVDEIPTTCPFTAATSAAN
jgi:hypothetical protein